MFLVRAFLAAAFALAAAVPSTLAQCPRPDLLDCGPCCTPAQAQLPKFPAFAHQSMDICWLDCNVDSTATSLAQWSAPVQAINFTGLINCGVFNASLRLRNAAGAVKWSGQFRLHYSRTWMETDPSGQPIQVWRFLVNGDLIPTTAAGGMPCPVPPCVVATNNRVRHTGYIDYARACGTNQFRTAWMISHVCDKIDHAPGFPRAGFFHPDRSYTFVGPAASFVPGPIQPTEGGGGALEAVRRLVYPAPGTTGPIQCDFEERAQHSLQPQNQMCACTISTGAAQWLVANLFIGGSCGTNVITTGAPYLPGFLSMGIGMWTDPTTFPGVECVRWNAGGYDWFDPCNGVLRQEVFFGVTTLQGFPANQVLCGGVGPTLPLIFIDQANSLRSGTTVMNIPYTSDHIINLNE